MLPLATILRIDFTVRNWARSCYVIRIKKIPDLASTRFRIHIGFQNIHSGERIKIVPDSPANSLDTCGRKPYPERKGCEKFGRGHCPGMRNIHFRFPSVDLFADTAAILISILSKDIMGCSAGKLICVCLLGIP